MTTLALIGANALWLLYLWLLSAIVGSYLSARKGYGEKPGLASGLFLFVIGPLLWLAWPARPDSKWRQLGPFGDRRVRRAAAPGAGPGAHDERGPRAAGS